eukprot:gene11175-13013_t
MNFSVQVENIPVEFRTSRRLKEFFNRIFPDEVLFATVAVTTPDLDRVVAERAALVREIEEAIGECEASHGKNRPVLQLVDGKPKPAACCAFYSNERTTTVDKVEYLKDQLAVLCAEVAYYQKKALAVTDDMELEMESPSPQQRVPFGPDSDKNAAPRASYTGSVLSTSTLDSASGLNAQSPLHIRISSRGESMVTAEETEEVEVEEGNVVDDDTTSSASNTRGNFPQQAFSMLTKQSSQAAFKITKAGAKVGAKAGAKVAQVVVDISEKVTSSYASATGFVTFKTRRAQVTAAQMPVLSQQYPKVTVTPAPAPSDVIWTNVSVTTSYTDNAAYLSAAFYYTGLLFWGVILASVAAISNLDTLQKYLPFLSVLGDTARAIIQGLLPVIIVLLFSLVVNWIMDAISRYGERRKTESAIQLEIFKWYFMYQIANVYLLLLAGSVFDSLESAIDNPSSILDLVSSALPNQSVFFVNYVLTTWLGGTPLVLLQLVPILLLILYRLIDNSERITRSKVKSWPFFPYIMQYGNTLPYLLYVLCVVQLYWVISPVISFFATGFFFTSYTAYKYMFAYVTIRAYESGGLFFYGLYRYSMTGLLAANVLFITYMGIKRGAVQAPLLAPLPFIVLYCWRYTEKKYKVLSETIPYDTAVRDDDDRVNNSSDAQVTHQELLDSFKPDFLKHPKVTGPAVVYPYPHRIKNEPLLDPYWALNDVYVEDIPEGMDPKEYIELIAQEAYESPELGLNSSIHSGSGSGSPRGGSGKPLIRHVSNNRLHA